MECFQISVYFSVTIYNKFTAMLACNTETSNNEPRILTTNAKIQNNRNKYAKHYIYNSTIIVIYLNSKFQLPREQIKWGSVSS